MTSTTAATPTVRETPARDRTFPTLNAVRLPAALEGQTEVDLRGALLQDYGIEIGGGFGDLKGKLWRIGLMGHGAEARNVYALAGALRTLLAA